MRAILIAALLVAGCSNTPPCESDTEAFAIAQEFVKRTLRSPSTASFPTMAADGVSVRRGTLEDGRCSFDVRLFVDAENAFGGTVRESFIVAVSPDGDSGEWSLVDITPH